MADEVIGITGAINVDDIIASFDSLINRLSNVGVKTDELSAQMTEALADIANSADKETSKTEAVLDILRQAIAKANEEFGTMPDAIKSAQEQVDKMQQAYSRLEEQFGKIVIGSDEFDKLNTQLKNQQEALSSAKDHLNELTSAYGNAQQNVSALQVLYDGLSQSVSGASTAMDAASISHAATGAAEGAATAVTTAQLAGKTVAEAAAATETMNASAAAEEAALSNSVQTKSLKELKAELKEAKSEYAALLKQYEESGSSNSNSNSNSLNDIDTQIRNKQREINKAQALLESEGGKEGNAEWADRQKQHIVALNNELETLCGKYLDASNAQKSALAPLNEYKQKISELETQIARLEGRSFQISGKESVDELRESLKEVRSASADAQQGINEISAESQKYAEQAKQLKEEIESLSAAYRQASAIEIGQQGGFESLEQKQAALDAIKAKIQEYGELTAQSTATSQTAYEEQVAQVKALESEYEQLSQLIAVGTSEGGAEYGAEIIKQMQQLQQEITAAKERLVELQSEATKSQDKIAGVGKEMSDMSAGVEKPTGIVTTFNDLAKLAKERMSEAADTVKSKASEMWDSLKNSSVGQTVGSAFDTLKSKATSAFDTIKNSSPVQSASASVRELGNSVASTASKFADWATGHGKVKQSIGELTKAIEGMGIPLSSAATGCKALGKAMWAMVSNPIGAVLGAIVVALMAVKKWLDKSAEGQRVMVKISAFFGSILSTVTDIIVIFGKYLFKNFDSKPVLTFAKALGSTLLDTIKAVGNSVSGLAKIFKGLYDGIKEGSWEKAWSGIKNGVNSIKDAGINVKDAVLSAVDALKSMPAAAGSVLGAIGKTVTNSDMQKEAGAKLNNAISDASKVMEIADKQKNAEIDLAKAKEKEAQMDIVIAEKRERIYKLTGKAKDAAIEETKALMRQKFDAQITAQTKIRDLMKERNGLHTKSLQHYADERNANIAVLRLQARRAASTRMLTRMQESNRRSMARKSTSAVNKDKNQQNAITAADDKYDETVAKNTQARINAELKLEQDVEEARIAAIADAGEREREERAYQHKKDMQQLAQQRDAAIQAEKDRQKAEFDAQQAIKKAQGGKIENFDWEKHGDKTETDKISAQYQVIGDYKAQSFTQENQKKELESMRNYLKEYGTIQEQRVALIEEWNEKIDKAQNEAERLSAVQGKNQAVRDFDNEQMKNGIDWEQMFGDVGNMSVKKLKSTKADLKGMLSNGDLDIKDYQAIVEQIDKVNNAIIDAQTNQNIFSGLITEHLKERKKLEMEVAEAMEQQVNAQQELGAAQADLNLSKFSVNDELKTIGMGDLAKKDITVADSQSVISSVSQKYGADSIQTKTIQAAFSKLAISTQKVQEAQDKLASSTTNLQNKQDKKDHQDDDENFYTKNKETFDNIKQAAGIGETASGLVGGEAGDRAGAAFAGVGSGVNAVADFYSGNYVGAVTNAMSAIGSFGTALGIGSGNAAETAKKIEELTTSNGYLKTSIDKLTEAMEDSNGTEAVDYYEKAVKAQKESNENYGEILNAQMHYNAHHHSNAYSWELDESSLKQVEALTGKSLKNSWESFYENLTPEDFDAIRTNLPKVWREMIEQGEYGDRFKEDWENYADQAGKVDELTDKINEKLTGITFDSLFDNFVSSLMDMDATAKDWADDISEYFAEAMLKYQLSDLLEDDMKKWYQGWSDIMADQGGKLTESQIAQMQKEQREWYQKAEDLRDNVFTITGYDEVAESSQSSTTGSYDGITQDQGSEISGRLTAVQWNGEQRLQYAIQQTALMTTVRLDTTQMRMTQETIRGYVSELVDIQQDSLSNLQKIVVNTNPLPEMKTVLDDIYKKIKNL